MNEQAPRRWGLLDALLAVGVGLFGSVVVASILLGAGDADATIGERFLVNLPLWAGLGLIPIWATSAKGEGPKVELGLEARWIDLPIGLVVGTALQLLVIPLIYWPLSGWIDSDEVEKPARELVDSAGGTAQWALLVITVAVMAPLVEEIFYRGMLQRGFARFMPMWTSVVLTAFVFGLMHFQPVQLLGLVVFGLAAGGLAAWSGRLGTSMSTHMVFNLWALWQASQL